MIDVAELDRQVDAQLDAEASQRYLFEQDKIPAYNAAIQRAMTACEWALANKKGAEEALSGLQETRLCRCNIMGGLTLDDLWSGPTTQSPLKVWSVLAFMAEPETFPSDAPYLTWPPSRSYVILNRVYLPGGPNERPVERMTIEEIAVARDNMFMSGNEVLASGPMRTYGYCIMGNRTDTDGVIQGSREVVFTPRSRFVTNPPSTPRFIGMSFLREPKSVALITDTIEFPRSMLMTLVEWSLQYIAVKQGDAAPLAVTAERDAAQLFNLNTQ